MHPGSSRRKLVSSDARKGDTGMANTRRQRLVRDAAPVLPFAGLAMELESMRCPRSSTNSENKPPACYALNSYPSRPAKVRIDCQFPHDGYEMQTLLQ